MAPEARSFESLSRGGGRGGLGKGRAKLKKKNYAYSFCFFFALAFPCLPEAAEGVRGGDGREETAPLFLYALLLPYH